LAVYGCVLDTASRVREIWKELKEIENWCIEHGHLKKNWRKDFYI